MAIQVIPFLSFSIITSLTPGPNNLTSASFGMIAGYKKTLKYLLGIAAGTFLVMLLCSLLSSTLLHYIPVVEKYLKYLGSCYILWLAYKTLHANYSSKDSENQIGSFANGLTLQLVNPKAIVYGLTMYSTFFAELTGDFVLLPLSALLLASICFCTISAWTLFGTLIQKYMQNERIKKGINTVFASGLVYTAVQIAGILS